MSAQHDKIMKKTIMRNAAMLLVMLLSAFCMQAQDAVKWDASVKMTSKTEGVIILTATMQDGWHVYGLTPVEDGPIATSITFGKAKGMEYKGKLVVSKNPVSMMDDMFGTEVTYWEGKVTFNRKFKIKKGTAPVVTVTVEYMACNDTNCQPPKTETFTLTLKK